MEGLLWGMCAGGVAGFLREVVKDHTKARMDRRLAFARMRACPVLRGLDTTEEHLLGMFELAAEHNLDEEHQLLDRAADRIEALAETYTAALRNQSVDMCEATMARTAAITALDEIGEAVHGLIKKTHRVTQLVQARRHVENNVQHLLKCLQTLALAKKSSSGGGGRGGERMGRPRGEQRPDPEDVRRRRRKRRSSQQPERDDDEKEAHKRRKRRGK